MFDRKYYDRDGHAQAEDWSALERELARVDKELPETRNLSLTLAVLALAGVGVAGLALYLH